MSESGDLYFRQIQAGDMANLVYLIGSRSTRECMIVDPAWHIAGLLEQAEKDGMEVVGALVTHYHQDHIGGSIFGMDIEGLAELQARKPVPVHANEHEAQGVAQIAGLSRSDIVPHSGGDTIALGGVRIRLLHTPGHTPGSQCFLVHDASRPGQLVAGDTLFLQGCGRVDLPGGDAEQMYRSIAALKKLPDDTVLFPGHLYSPEPCATLAEQKQTNYALRAGGLDQFLMMMGRG